MAKTQFATSNDLTRKAWNEKLFRDSVKESYFSKFQGSGSDSVVQVKEELTKDKGDRITFGLRMRLTGAGVTSGQILEGNEERLVTYSNNVTLEQYRHAVRDDGAMSRQRAMFSISDEARAAIKDWMSERIDQLQFDAIGVGAGVTTEPSQIFYRTGASTFLATGTAATARSALVAGSSTLTLNFISFIKAFAKTGGDRRYVPLRPVKVDGKEYFIMLVHPDAMFDLKASTEWQAAQRDAAERGKNNPLFLGAAGVWDGVVIHEHENCAIRTDGGAGSNVPWTRGVFMGAQALCWAWGQRPEVIQETFDYQNEEGYGVNMIAGVAKSRFNSLDYGSLGVFLSRTNVAGA
jgi:N4-gp56 family major capsid protein